MEKKLSIIVPIYNAEEFIERGLDSIPVRDDLEVICIDDCSTDSSPEILKNYTRLPLKILTNDPNMGIGYSTRVGIKAATGEYITGLDIDDYYITEILNRCLDTINLGEYDIYNFSYLENDGRVRRYDNIAGLPGKWIRRSLTNKATFSNRRELADVYFMRDLRRFKPTELNLDVIYYRYNYPRKGSVSYDIEKRWGVPGHED